MPLLLVVDDELELVEMLVDDLKNEGFEVVSAGTATQGLKMIEAHKPALVISDINLGPEGDGLSLARSARSQGFTSPFLMVTGLLRTPAKEIEALGREIGPVDFIEKPFDRAQLHSAIARLMGSR